MILPSLARGRALIEFLFSVRTSHQIILLLSIILIGVIAGAYLVIGQLSVLKNDAETINKLGVIRGSIQLISKREINDAPAHDFIANVDASFAYIKAGYMVDPTNASHIEAHELNQLMSSLEASWLELKQLYRDNRRGKNKAERILYKSDRCWDVANEVVYRVQKISEAKLKNYRNMITMILTGVAVFILIIITIVYRIVHNHLEHDAVTDSLTGLFNRNHFNKILREQIALHKRYDTQFSFTLMDIDFFKQINDEFGHPLGDKVLVKLSNLLQNHSRDVDYLFRIGGEEFAVLSPHCDLQQATLLAEKYRKLIASADFNIKRKMTVSIGVTQSFQNCDEASLYKNADTALYQAKKAGRNKVASFS